MTAPRLRALACLLLVAIPAVTAPACGPGAALDRSTPTLPTAPRGSSGPLHRPVIEIVPVVELESPARTPLMPNDTVTSACAQLTARSSAIPPGATLRCGPDEGTSFHGPKSVRAWLTSAPALLSMHDFADPQIWYDEDTLPTHAHVVVDLTRASRDRYEAFAKAYPKARIATVIDGVVENVAQVGTLGAQGRFFITPSVPIGAESNEPTTSSIGVAMGAKPR